jgi:uncharacterized protein GlcG (DUF336 family)
MINRVPNERIHAAVAAVFAAAERDGRAMALAVVDEAAELVFATRMEATPARVLTHAIRKAYTAATMQRDTIVLRDQDAELGKTLADWGDPRLTHLVGGVVLRRDGQWWGGVGAGGNATDRDDTLARLAATILMEA